MKLIFEDYNSKVSVDQVFDLAKQNMQKAQIYMKKTFNVNPMKDIRTSFVDHGDWVACFYELYYSAKVVSEDMIEKCVKFLDSETSKVLPEEYKRAISFRNGFIYDWTLEESPVSGASFMYKNGRSYHGEYYMIEIEISIPIDLTSRSYLRSQEIGNHQIKADDYEWGENDMVVTPNNRREFIEWLSDHKQAFSDLVRYARMNFDWEEDESDFDNLDQQSAGDLDEWLSNHKTLREDWIAYAMSNNLLN